MVEIKQNFMDRIAVCLEEGQHKDQLIQSKNDEIHSKNLWIKRAKGERWLYRGALLLMVIIAVKE